jgi:phosphate transport system protein
MPQYRRKFRKKLTQLNDDLEELGSRVSKNYKASINLFKDYSDEQYNMIIENTKNIIDDSLMIEQECLSLLAREQPVARDLRYIEGSIKIASHLKRMGKLAQDIADVANSIKVTAIPSEPLNIMNKMAEEVEAMMSRSIRSFLTNDIEEAAELESDDDIVDDLFDEFLLIVTDSMKADTSKIDVLVPFLLVSRYLERLADRSESIGSRVILMQGYINEHDKNS